MTELRQVGDGQWRAIGSHGQPLRWPELGPEIGGTTREACESDLIAAYEAQRDWADRVLQALCVDMQMQTARHNQLAGMMEQAMAAFQHQMPADREARATEARAAALARETAREREEREGG